MKENIDLHNSLEKLINCFIKGSLFHQVITKALMENHFTLFI